MASQKIQGLNIKLSADTTAIDSALKNVNKTLNSTQSELKYVDKLLKFDPKNTTLLTQKQKLLSDAINQTKNKLEQLNKAKELADKDDSVDKSSKQYRNLVQQIEEANIKLKSFEKQSKEVGNALNDGSEKALKFGDVLKANLVSDAIVGGVKAIGNAIVSIGKAMGDTIKETASYADEVNTLAKNYNLSTKQIQQYMKAGELIDVDINTIAKSMSKLTKNMTSTSSGVVGAFKKLGIAVKDSDGNLRDSNVVFNETIQALSQIANETEQDSLALEIFGKSSADLGSLINGGAEQLAEFNKYLEENNLLLSQEELDSLNSVQDGFDTLSATFDSIKQKIVAELAPVITPLLEDVQKYIIDHKDELIELVTGIVDYLTSDEGKKMFEDIVNSITSIVEDLIPSIPSLIEGIKAIGTVLKPVVDLLKAAAEFITIINGTYDKDKVVGTLADPYYRKQLGLNINGGNINNIGNSGGFGEYASGGFGNTITLNASFVANGTLDEKQALRFADLMTQRINENLGGQL